MTVVVDIKRVGTYYKNADRTATPGGLPNFLNEDKRLYGVLRFEMDLKKGCENFKDEGYGDVFVSFFDYIKKTNKQGTPLKEVSRLSPVAMLTTLFICLCIPIVIHADSITTTSNSTSVEPVFSIEDELKKIASFCLTYPGLQELTGNIIGRIPATFFAETLIDSANMLISLEELRSSLGFPPAGPWTHKREPTDNDTLEEYFESEVYYKDVSLDSKWFHEKNLPPAISFLDKHLPEVRQIHRHVYAEKMRAYEGKLIDKGAVDDMISKYREVRLKMFDPTSKLMSNRECRHWLIASRPTVSLIWKE
ncbi:unnamed protein product [Caenorhabditis brenneri]